MRDDDEQLKIELLSHWKLEAKSRKNLYGFHQYFMVTRNECMSSEISSKLPRLSSEMSGLSEEMSGLSLLCKFTFESCFGVRTAVHVSEVSGNSRSRPFPGIPAFHSRSQSLGMSFSFPFPFPKVGNAIFHSRSQNLEMKFSIPVPVSGNGL